MSRVMEANARTDNNQYTPEYGDTFRHIITGNEQTVHTVRDGEVTWVDGGYDAVEDLVAAVEDGTSLYEPVAVGDGVYEGDGY